MYLIGLAVQMYEAEDVKTRLQQQQQQQPPKGGETGRRKRRQEPYDSSRQNSQNNSRPRSTRSDKPHQSEEVVTSSTDHSLPKRANKTSADKSSPQAAKQPTLVELLQAGVERPPNGPPRLTTPSQRVKSAVEFPERPGYSGLSSSLTNHTRSQTPNASSDSSCIVQLLRCPPNKADVERRMWPPTSLNEATSLRSNSGPLIVEADSSNMPLDADLLYEMTLFSNSEDTVRSCPMCEAECFSSSEMENHLNSACMLAR